MFKSLANNLLIVWLAPSYAYFRIKFFVNFSVKDKSLLISHWVFFLPQYQPKNVIGFLQTANTTLNTPWQHVSVLFRYNLSYLFLGVFINEIVSNMNRKIDATKNFERLLHLYPVSDRVIVRLWKGLNISQEITNKPNYGAALFIELHEINNKYRVKVS